MVSEEWSIGFRNGNLCYWDEASRVYRFAADDALAEPDRPCPSCGMLPTEEGYDSCLGYLPGIAAACCGHSTESPYLQFIDDGQLFQDVLEFIRNSSSEGQTTSPDTEHDSVNE